MALQTGIHRAGWRFMSGSEFSGFFRIKGLKGQASLIDVVLLGMFISIVLVYTIYQSTFSQGQKNIQENSYAQSMFFSLMEYRNSTYGGFNNTGNMSFGEALDFYLCGKGISESDLNATAKYILDRSSSPLYNYIFYSSAITTASQLAAKAPTPMTAVPIMLFREPPSPFSLPSSHKNASMPIIAKPK